MLVMRKLLPVILLGMILSVQVSFAQEEKNYKEIPYWTEMMQEPGVNFAEVQKAFYTYWEGREITKGCGYKPFKRWEYFWQSRLTEEGNLPMPGYLWKEYKNSAQNRSTEDEGNWVNLGPIQQPTVGATGQPNGNGRINAIAFHPTDEDIFYIGAPAGGLWATTDGGATWSTNTDDLPTLGVSSIVVDYDNPDVIYLGTGDRDAGDSGGVGVMKSTDGGLTWNQSNTGMGDRTVGRMIMHPDNNNELLAAAGGGIYKTTDAGANWEMKVPGNFKEVIYHPTNSDIVYAASGGSYYRSDDGGETWESGATGYGGGARAVIAVTPAAPDNVYVLTSNSGNGFNALYKSTDAGLTFTTQSTSPNILEWSCYGTSSGGQGWYDLEIAADPNQEDVIYSGGVNIWKSVDGGQNWDIRAHWVGDCGVAAVHADHHVFEYNPLNDRLYNGNDGGLYWSEDGGVVWNEITSGIAISQVYKLGQSKTERDYVINGYQDNGTGVFEGTTEGWMTVYGGDGMDCTVDHEDASYAYGELYYGSIFRLKDNYSEGTITNGISESGNWVTPFVLHEGNSNTMFVGMNNIWRSDNIKSNPYSVDWYKVSDFSGGKFNVLENSPANTEILYAARESSLYVTMEASSENASWESISAGLGSGSSSINDIEAHPFFENIVYVAKGTGVYMSEDYGQTWTDISGSLPNSTVSTVEYYKGSYNGLYAGTDLGIYFKDNDMEDWMNYSEGYPLTAATTDLEIFYDPVTPNNHVIRVSTYGRGMWESPVYIGTPVANFSSNLTEIPAGCTVDFYDMSTGTPFEYTWTFEGGNPSISNEQHPADISFATPGEYSITLEVSNPNGSDTKTITQMITVTEGQAPNAVFMAEERAFCSSPYITTFHDLSDNCPTFWEWSFEPNTIEFLDGTDANSSSPKVRFLEETSYDVTLVVGNDAGTTSVTMEDYISTSGIILPFSDDFTNGFEFENWTIENPDGGRTWEIAEIDGNKVAKLSFFEYNAAPGDQDELISPVLDFNGFENVYIHFRHAYAKRIPQWTDSLSIYVSPNCGSSWVKVLALGDDGEGSFATVAPTEDEFIPTSNSEWCEGSYSTGCNTVDISQFAGFDKIKVKFVSENNNGNNLYIDDIVINNSTDIEPNIAANHDLHFNVYPNPADEQINMVVNGVSEDMTIEFANVHGQVLFTQKVDGSNDTFYKQVTASSIKSGIYVVTLKSANSTITRKIVVK
jgi:PKD repeat protein/photosystem II stability/assembly factor-like uncharacterized protein